MAPLGLALLVGLTVQVDEGTCTSSVAVRAALDGLEHEPLTVTIFATGASLQARFEAPRAPSETRTLRVRSEDCEALPRMIHFMAERYLRRRPLRTWQKMAGPSAPRAPPKVSLPPTPLERRHRYTLRLVGGAGATTGADGSGPGLRVAAGAQVLGETLGLGGQVGVRVVPRVDFGAGAELRITTPWLAGRLLVGGRLGPVPWQAGAGVAAGLAIAEPRGFEGAQSDVAPVLEPSLGLRVGLTDGLQLGAEARIRAVGPRFTGPDAAADYTAPLLRLSLSLIVGRDIAFF